MLGYNPIETLNDTWMTSLELRSLNLANCSLTKIPKKIAEIQGKKNQTLCLISMMLEGNQMGPLFHCFDTSAQSFRA